jgi:hypothetical protein
MEQIVKISEPKWNKNIFHKRAAGRFVSAVVVRVLRQGHAMLRGATASTVRSRSRSRVQHRIRVRYYYMCSRYSV